MRREYVLLLLLARTQLGGAQTASGETREAKVGVLLGTGLREIYAPPQGGQTAPQLLRVFPDESSLMIMADGKAIKGTWDTDGETLILSGGTAPYSVKVADLKVVKGVPAEKKFSVRLIDELSSRKTHEGAIVKALSTS